MPYDIGRDIESAGAAIAGGLTRRFEQDRIRKRQEQEEANRRQREKIIAQMKVRARGAEWKPDYDQTIEAGGNAEDVVSAAQEELARKRSEAAKFSEQEDLDRQASVGVSRAAGLLKNPQFRAMKPDDPQRQAIADASIRGSIAQRQEAAKALEPPEAPKPEKPTEGERDRAARIEYWKSVGSPKDAKWQLWKVIGGDPPDKTKEIPSPASRAGDVEQAWRGLVKNQPEAQKAVAKEDWAKKFDLPPEAMPPPATPSERRLAGMSPDQVRDSAFQEANYVGQLKAQAAGGEVPEAQAQAIREKIDSLQQRLDRIRSRR